MSEPETDCSADLTRKQTLHSWLNAHEISRAQVLRAIAYVDRMLHCEHGVANEANAGTLGVDAADAWQVATSALCSQFPEHAPSIVLAQGGVEVNFEAKEQQYELPYTLDRRPKLPPLVAMEYSGSPADILCVAHEFAHAVQIQLSSQHSIVPILREVAAFIGELALLRFLEEEKSPIAKAVRSAFFQENGAYLASDVAYLESALDDSSSPYNYRWNYPIARVLAVRLFELLPAEKLWQVFVGRFTLSECIEMADFPFTNAFTKNYLSPLPKDQISNPTVDAYRSLGMMVLLDIDYLQGRSEQTIEHYYADLLEHMKKQTAFIMLDNKKRPSAYATWCVNADNADRITLTRQSAPFGHHIALHKTLKARFPENFTVHSLHERSARRNQTAW